MDATQLRQFPVALKGNFYEDFFPGASFRHGRGRTLGAADNTLFNALTVQLNPAYLDLTEARRQGHSDVPIHPWLVFSTVFGLSVEDLSEKGGAFLGVDDLTFHRDVYPGATLTAQSVVKECRRSSKNPRFGIVTWATEGRDENDRPVVSFSRTNMVVARDGGQS
jgi:itaconyl-CoA hydratase